MNVRSLALSVIFLAPTFSFPESGHHHHHHPSTYDLIKIIEKKDDEIFWVKIKTAAVAASAGFIVGWIVAKS